MVDDRLVWLGARRRWPPEEGGRDRGGEGAPQGSLGDGLPAAGRIVAYIGATARGPAARIDRHAARRQSDHPDELALLTRGPAGYAGPGRVPSEGRPGRRDATYDATSPESPSAPAEAGSAVAGSADGWGA
jgi:hypothetical protein